MNRFIACLALLSCSPGLLAAGGCGKGKAAADVEPMSPEEAAEAVKMLSTKNPTAGGFGADIRVVAAGRLAEMGPAAAQYGAVEPLEKLAKDKDPKVREAATAALAKIKGQ